MQKIIESGNIKLGQVASDALGVSGRLMLKALAEGETDGVKLAEMARGRPEEQAGGVGACFNREVNPGATICVERVVDPLCGVGESRCENQ